MLLPVLSKASGTGEGEGCMPLKELSADNLAFRAGERLDYSMSFKWGPVRTEIATPPLTVENDYFNGRNVYKAGLRAKTTRFYDSIFKVREDFNSWFDRDGLLPRRFTRDTREGSYIAKDDFNFVWDAPEPYIAAQFETGKKPRRSFAIPIENSCTHDVISLFYKARNVDMSRVREGEPNPMVFAIDDDVYTIGFVFRGRETRDIKGYGKVRTMKFEVSVVKGEVFADSGIFIWFTDDDNRVPVYIEAGLKIGMVKATLTGASGLRHKSALNPKK